MVTIERMWTESFRPKVLDEVVGQKDVVKRLKQFVRRADFPHMLFSGPPGVGKTTCAEVLISEISLFSVSLMFGNVCKSRATIFSKGGSSMTFDRW